MAFSLDDIITGIRNNDSKIFDHIISSTFRIIRHFVINNSGSTQDAEDIFQDTIFAIILKARKGKLSINDSFKNYFIKACKNQWLKNLENRKEKRIDPSVDSFLRRQYFQSDFDMEMKYIDECKLFDKYFNTLSEACQKLLSLLKRGRKCEKIAVEMNFGDPMYVYKKKCVCMKTLGNRVRKDPNYQEIICR